MQQPIYEFLPLPPERTKWPCDLTDAIASLKRICQLVGKPDDYLQIVVARYNRPEPHDYLQIVVGRAYYDESVPWDAPLGAYRFKDDGIGSGGSTAHLFMHITAALRAIELADAIKHFTDHKSVTTEQ